MPAPTVLHGAFDGRRLLLWAETRLEFAAAAQGARGKRQQDLPARSPYDPGAAALIAALSASTVASAKFRAEAAILWLPSVDGEPLTSGGLVADPPDGAKLAALRPWTVSAVSPPGPAAIEFLCVCAGRRTLAPGVIVGEDLAYWAAAMRFAAAIVARQHFLPDLVEDDGELLARWRPAPTYADSQAMAQIAAAMPDACRAAGGAQCAPSAPAAAILSAFIELMVDQLARTARPHPSGATLDSADAQWLAALARDDPKLEGDRVTLADLRQRVRAWWRPLAISAASPFRLCLRLEEPEAIVTDTPADVLYDSAEQNRPWRLRYLLQANHDPSLMVTASQAWSARGPQAQQLRRDGFEVREFLLRALGEAARICPPIEDSLRGGIPDAHKLDAAGAARFLIEQAAALEQAGFGIVLPASWSSKGTKVRLTTRAKVKSPKMSSMTGLSLSDLVEVDWEAADRRSDAVARRTARPGRAQDAAGQDAGPMGFAQRPGDPRRDYPAGARCPQSHGPRGVGDCAGR